MYLHLLVFAKEPKKHNLSEGVSTPVHERKATQLGPLQTALDIGSLSRD